MDEYRHRRSLAARLAQLFGLGGTGSGAQDSRTDPEPAQLQGEGPGSLLDHLAAASRRSSPNPLTAPTATDDELTAPLSLYRVETVLTDSMGYRVQRHTDGGHPCLLGMWDGFPFVIEEPLGHEGWLLVSGDREEPVREGDREEISASVNDWNRDRFFPTVAVVDVDGTVFVRAIYLVDLSAGVTTAQLRLHLDTALASCTQALRSVGPLLPEI